MRKEPKFPMVIKCGSAPVTIYRSQSKQGCDSFQVRYYRGTEEVRFTRASFEEAQEEAQSAARSLAHGELDVLTLRSDDRLSYVRSIEALKPTGVGIEAASTQFAEAHALLNGTLLLEAVRFYIQRRQQSSVTKTVGDIAAELVQHISNYGKAWSAPNRKARGLY